MENPLMSRLAGLPPVSREGAREILPLYDALLKSHEAMVSYSAQETKDAGFVDGSIGLTETARLFRDALIRRADKALARRAGRNRVEKAP
jgi:PleD family two-component response regulator